MIDRFVVIVAGQFSLVHVSIVDTIDQPKIYLNRHHTIEQNQQNATNKKDGYIYQTKRVELNGNTRKIDLSKKRFENKKETNAIRNTQQKNIKQNGNEQNEN